MPFKPFKFSGFRKGLYAPANLFDTPPGTLPRITNLLFTERGGLLTIDGSHVISKPAPAPPLDGFITSGAISGVAPPAPTVPLPGVGGSVRFNVSGTGTNIVTLNFPSPMQRGDVVIGVISNKLFVPGVGDTAHVPDLPSGWVPFIQIGSTPAGSCLASWLVAYRVIDGTEGPSVSFTASSIGGGFKVSILNALIVVSRGANASSPIDNVQFGQGSAPGGSYTNPVGVTTHFTNDLIVIHDEGADQGSSLPNAPVGTNLDLHYTQDLGGSIAGEIFQNFMSANQSFVGPGVSPTYTSTGWVSGQGMASFLIALGAAQPITGIIDGFLPSSTGVITPAPIITGSSTLLTAPQGAVFDKNHRLWIADNLSGNLGGLFMWKTPQTQGGNTAPDTAIQGALTSLRNPYDLYLDQNQNIWVANNTGPNVLEFIATATGNIAPAAFISGSNTTLVAPIGIAVDSVGNVMVLDAGVNSIKIWNNGVIGNFAPSRVITGAATLLQNPLAIRIDPSGMVWVACGKSGASAAYLLGFTLTSSSSGNVAPTLQLTDAGLNPPSGNGGPTGLAFDKSSNIYVAVDSQHYIEVYAKPAASGTFAPIQTIQGFTNGPFGIAVAQT